MDKGEAKVKGDRHGFAIPGKLPTLNEIINAAKKKAGIYGAYRTMKRIATEKVIICAKNIPLLNCEINLYIYWWCENKRYDKDNIQAGVKFIWDGLVKAGVIPNDTWEYQGDTTHRFGVDKDDPHIEIYIEEV